MNKQQLASRIWESANRMRSKIEANEYKDYILGFIFYKFLSDKEVRYLRENDWTDEYLPELTEEDSEMVERIRKTEYRWPCALRFSGLCSPCSIQCMVQTW